MAGRLYTVCSGLSIEEPMMEAIWKLVKEILIEETDHLANSHIDNLLVCSIYACCAKNRANHKRFSEILGEYFSSEQI